MKKLFIPFVVLLFLVSFVSAATLNRNLPSSVEPGQTFTVTYQTSDTPNSDWFVAWHDDITGGCSPTSNENFLSGSDSSPATSPSKTFTAPTSGTCTFTGYYQFTNEQQKTLNSSSIRIYGGSGGTGPISSDRFSMMMWIIAGVVVVFILMSR